MKSSDPMLNLPIRRACRILSRKWVLSVLHHLLNRPLRFSELHKLLPGISTKSLGRVLQHLEKHGLIKRTIVSARPPQVSYSITPEDALLRQIIQLISRWGAEEAKQMGSSPGGEQSSL